VPGSGPGVAQPPAIAAATSAAGRSARANLRAGISA
jgi:hypothetical protein